MHDLSRGLSPSDVGLHRTSRAFVNFNLLLSHLIVSKIDRLPTEILRQSCGGLYCVILKLLSNSGHDATGLSTCIQQVSPWLPMLAPVRVR
jgi:hypothetical protein